MQRPPRARSRVEAELAAALELVLALGPALVSAQLVESARVWRRRRA